MLCIYDIIISVSACSSDIGYYKMCSGDNSSGQISGSGTCIYKELFNDGVVNCPYAGCADECDSKDCKFIFHSFIAVFYFFQFH